MLPIGHLARIVQLADEADWKVLVAGCEQLAAVQEGGGMRLLAWSCGYVQLAEPVQYEQEWERSASLRLRAGDASVLADYDMRSRIRGGDPEQVMEAAEGDEPGPSDRGAGAGRASHRLRPGRLCRRSMQ